MGEASAVARILEEVPLRVRKGRKVRLAGLLKAEPTLEEVTFLATPYPPRAAPFSRAVRAFRVHGAVLEADGARDGDYLLVQAGFEYGSGAIVLAEVAGQFMLRRLIRLNDGTIALASTAAETLPMGEVIGEARIIGRFAGIVRRRGFGCSRGGRRAPAPEGWAVRSNDAARRMVFESATSLKPISKVTRLRGRLGALESTFAGTANPRLREALRAEAERVRWLLQNEAPYGAKSISWANSRS
jgi:hypothetical protein